MFSNNLVIKILDYIDNNLYKKISIDELSNIFHYNKDYIMRLFKKEIGFTIIDYINRKRIFNSLEAFKYKNYSILNIAINYGFYSQEYYSEIFHKIIGTSPINYYKFVHLNKSLDYETISKIQNSISELDYQMRNINNYIYNVPPKNSVKNLTIFK